MCVYSEADAELVIICEYKLAWEFFMSFNMIDSSAYVKK